MAGKKTTKELEYHYAYASHKPKFIEVLILFASILIAVFAALAAVNQSNTALHSYSNLSIYFTLLFVIIAIAYYVLISLGLMYENKKDRNLLYLITFSCN